MQPVNLEKQKGGAEMQLLIKQRVFSWSDTYDIYDEQGNQKYFVKNEFFVGCYNWQPLFLYETE